MQIDGLLVLQAYPASMVQLDEHPSPESRLLSSHSSLTATIPSPHTLAQTSCEVSDPPAHINPDSTWQRLEHPSPATVLLSSHVSA